MNKIFIVEDSPAIQVFYQKCLYGHYLITGIADNGKEAIEQVSLLKPDLILMDIVINGDMDGINTASVILKNHSIPILFVSSQTDTQTLERAKLTKPFGYILKPVEAEVLRTNIRIALDVYANFRTLDPTDHNYKPAGTPKTDTQTVRSQFTGHISQSPEILNVNVSENSRRVEIVNNRFMKQYWIVDENYQ